MRRYLGLLFTYRSREGTVAWLFHRISGLAIWAFLVLHVLDIYLVGDNPGAYDDILRFYASPVGRVLEVLLGAALLYHALNGLRIVIIDLWPSMAQYHKVLWRASWVIFILLGLPGAAIILLPLYRDSLTSLLHTLGIN